MKVAIMQPYFFPYIGYFQLINAVDIFIIYDNIEFTKKGWINRNKILLNDKEYLFTIPIQKSSDFLHIKEKNLALDSLITNSKILNQIKNGYKKAPYFKDVYNLIEDSLLYQNKNLFEYIFYSLTNVLSYLEIKTKIIKSSSIDINHNLKSQTKVIEICKKLEATNYINPMGGVNLYDKTDFKLNEVTLRFLKCNDIFYKQFNNYFIPWLSIIDVIMFNSKVETKILLNQYELI